jgi:hypothetical protein
VKFKDYRDLEFPQFLVDLGFNDDSYHNDASARASVECVGDASGFRWVWIWVAEDDVSDREFQNAKRFTVCKGRGEEMDDMDSETVVETDDPVVCETVCRHLIEQLGGTSLAERHAPRCDCEKCRPELYVPPGATAHPGWRATSTPSQVRSSELRTAFASIARTLPGAYRALERALVEQPLDVQREFWRLVQNYESELTMLKRKVREPWRR